MGRIQGLSDTPQVLTGSELLKTGAGYVFSVTLAYEGATAGNKAYLRDGLDGAARALVVLVLPAAAGTLHLEWAQGKPFTTGLFFDEGQAATCYASITYK